MGIGMGTRYVPDVDDDLDFVCAQHFYKFQQRASGMHNGKKAVCHLASMFWQRIGSPASVAERTVACAPFQKKGVRGSGAEVESIRRYGL
jgi:hypothetical protein